MPAHVPFFYRNAFFIRVGIVVIIGLKQDRQRRTSRTLKEYSYFIDCFVKIRQRFAKYGCDALAFITDLYIYSYEKQNQISSCDYRRVIEKL